MKIELAKTEVIHFVGIGGIGMSGLSLIMRGKGFKVQGSDVNSNKNIDRRSHLMRMSLNRNSEISSTISGNIK